MTDADLLQRFIFDKAPIRGEYVRLTESFQTIIEQHNYPAPIKRLLGEALCVAALLSAIIKYNGRLTVQFQGKGKLRLLLAQCDHQFQVRALAKWTGDLSYDDLMVAFNEGVLMIMLDSGVQQARYQGIVAWRGNSLAESIEGYFKESEQLATKIWLAVDDTKAVGFLLQAVPEQDKHLVELVKETPQNSWERITSATQLKYEDLIQLDYPSLLEKLYPTEEIRVFPETSVVFNCTCSKKRSENAISLLSQEEVEAELQSKPSIVVTCDFCNKEYIFDRVDIANIFAHKNKPSDIQLH